MVGHAWFSSNVSARKEAQVPWVCAAHRTSAGRQCPYRNPGRRDRPTLGFFCGFSRDFRCFTRFETEQPGSSRCCECHRSSPRTLAGESDAITQYLCDLQYPTREFTARLLTGGLAF